jgi:hypothetical protein
VAFRRNRAIAPADVRVAVLSLQSLAPVSTVDDAGMELFPLDSVTQTVPGSKGSAMSTRRIWVCALIVSASLAGGAGAADVDLHWIVRTADGAALTAALATDIDVNAADDEGVTPLHLAALRGDADMVGALLERGANARAADARGRTPLHLAGQANDAKVIALLVAHGAAVDARDQNGNTALHVAARLCNERSVRALLTAGADPMAANAAAQTPLHVLGRDHRVLTPAVQQMLDGLAATMVKAGADAAIIADGLPGLKEPAAPEEKGDSRDYWIPYSEIGPTLLNWEQTYPDRCKRYDVGLSTQDRHLWAIKISDNVNVDEDEPEHKYIATMHGDEIVGTTMCMYLIEDLMTLYGSDPQITNLVDEVEIWIMPLMNPDGYDRNPRTRYNAQGLDLNRNFPEGAYGEPNDPAGRPTEVQVVMNWVPQHSFTLSANFHGGAAVVNYPFDNDNLGSNFSPTPDEDMFVFISEAFSRYNTRLWNGAWYHGITNGAEWYSIDGGMQDWNYRYMGCNEVTIELGNTKQPSAAEIRTYWGENRNAMLSYMETCLIGIRGVITDAQTGDPVAATIRVVGREHDIFSDPDVGDYHRMLLPGTYDLEFVAPGYDPLTVTGIVVQSGAATRVDVQLGAGAAVTYPNGGETLTVGQPVMIAWTGSPAAQFEVQYTANAGQTGATTDGFESGALSDDYTTGGDADWFVTTQDAHEGFYSARAGDISHNDVSWLRRTVDTGGALSFWYRVSSEEDYDFFNFYIDGGRVLHVAGESGWQEYTTTLAPGAHTLEWEYDKDYSESEGEDTVWIDDLEFVDDQTEWHDIALTDVGATTTPWTPDAPGSDYKVRVRAYYGPGSYGAWDASDAAFTVEEAAYPLGDLNCDGVVSAADIDPFVIALTGGQAAYEAQFPDCVFLNADCNSDGAVSAADIDPFVTILTSAR